MASAIPVIHGASSHLKYCDSFTRYCASRAKGSQKMNDLPTLATCWSGRLAMLCREVTVLLLMKALDND